jgi:hypothetical protein
MTFHIPHAASSAKMRREDRIGLNSSAISSLVKAIDDSITKIHFGSSVDAVLNHYQFSSRETTRAFFKEFLAERDPDDVDDQEIEYRLTLTLNCADFNATSPTFVHDTFLSIADALVTSIISPDSPDETFVAFIVGPTGSGKTAFSKSLLTTCRQYFWKNGFIPTRIEYSKFDSFRERRGRIKYEDVFAFIRECQLRDLLNFVFFSDSISNDDIPLVFASIRSGAHNIAAAVNALVEESESLQAMSRRPDFSLRDAQKRIRSIIQPLDNQERDRVLYAILNGLEKMRNLPTPHFLVSLDGFDTIRIDDFVLTGTLPEPVQYILDIMGAIETGAISRVGSQIDVPCSFLIYVRDTTYERIRSDLFNSIGGRYRDSVFWIAPPRYDKLITTASNLIAGDIGSEQSESAKIVGDICHAFNRAVFYGTSLDAQRHMSLIFGSNARQMKEHFKQTVISSLERALDAGLISIDESRPLPAARIWREFVRNSIISRLPNYVVLEDLFLDSTRQLFTKLEIDSFRLNEALKRDDIEESLVFLRDRYENSAAFGCVFNYYLEKNLDGSSPRKLPLLLVQVRFMQYLALQGKMPAGRIADFLRGLGYGLSHTEFQLICAILLRAELIKADGSAGKRYVEDLSYYVSFQGRVVLDTLLYSVTYLSESLLSAIHFDSLVSSYLIGRKNDNARWVADCVSNSCIAAYLVKEIEQVEKKNSVSSNLDVDFDKFRIYSKLKERISEEGSHIINSRSSATKLQWARNVESLKELEKTLGYLELVHMLDATQ